jgi:hypothetical protein
MLTPGRVARVVSAGMLLAAWMCADLKFGATAQREPAAPKELVERVGAWAEVFLDRCPSFTAIETREEQRAGKKGILENKRTGLAEYSARRQDDGQVVESRKPMAAEGSAGEKGKHPEAAPMDERSSPFAIVARVAERNQDRMKFVFAQDTSDPTLGVLSDYVLLGYRQIRGDALAELDGKGVYPRGQAWVDPDDGRIFRIEDEVSYKNLRQTTEVEFSRENPLQTWLPKQITIRTFAKGRLEQQVVITYSGFSAVEGRVGSASRN